MSPAHVSDLSADVTDVPTSLLIPFFGCQRFSKGVMRRRADLFYHQTRVGRMWHQQQVCVAYCSMGPSSPCVWSSLASGHYFALFNAFARGVSGLSLTLSQVTLSHKVTLSQVTCESVSGISTHV
jgi:hypothetical protein